MNATAQIHLPAVPVVITQRPPFLHGFELQKVAGAAVVVAVVVTGAGLLVTGVTGTVTGAAVV